eukprot:TRINITY_DN212664_c0_g2_i3.p1 TRINITY_DN212664_c0_g2~~TRINITY_DN212664_c0_g2_i3.p1  ORF type:complete len:694 (+),score=181.96 TRINITY_DN212664_c0_g2_i3:706-2787(+)
MLTMYLREHQREGVKFMFECVSGLKDYAGTGCILADDMGLGKTFMCVSLMYTCWKQGPLGVPVAKRSIIVSPSSLVKNWGKEVDKWCHGNMDCICLNESSKDKVTAGIKRFVAQRATAGKRAAPILILSYEVFRMYSDMFPPDCCDLLICDEAHRLKNATTQTAVCLDKLNTKKRVLVSGTPLQNDLKEYFALVNFCNPGLLGTPAQFTRYYETPFLRGREPDATESERAKGEERGTELSKIGANFVIKRTNAILSKHLPPKYVQIVFCKLSKLQKEIYTQFAKVIADPEKMKNKMVLQEIQNLIKLVNHPRLLWETKEQARAKGKVLSGFPNLTSLFPEGYERFGRRSVCSELSGKMQLLHSFLRKLRLATDDRIVIVSNYTQTLDIIRDMCREERWPVIRLDGTISSAKRQPLVDELNDPTSNQFVFLLSSKAGGCGLNLIGANRLIMFDAAWNPANDKQAAARVWRDGQKKRVYLYRFFAAGTIDEKIYQRQLSKEGLANVVDDDQPDLNKFSRNELRDLFKVDFETESETHEKYCNKCYKSHSKIEEEDGVEEDEEFDLENPDDLGLAKMDQNIVSDTSLDSESPKEESKEEEIIDKTMKEQEGNPREDDLNKWGHHWSVRSVDDSIMKSAGKENVSFIFSLKVKGELPVSAVSQTAAPMKRKRVLPKPTFMSTRPRRTSKPITRLGDA